MGRRIRKNRGFTLAELLVATTLLSLIMSAVYFLFYNSMGSWRAMEDDFDTYRDGRNVFTLIQRDIQNIHKPAGHLMEGARDEMTLFVITEAMDVEAGEGRRLMRVRYRYRRNAQELIREESLVEATLPKRPQRDRELDRSRVRVRRGEDFLVASNVRDFQLRYVWMPMPVNRDYKMPPPRIEPVLASEHKLLWGLPNAIEITMVLTEPERRTETHTIVSRIPMPPPNYFLNEERLFEMLGSAAR